MKKENGRVSHKDAQLFRVALNIAQGFVESNYNLKQTGGIEGQKDQAEGVCFGIMEELKKQLDKDPDDMDALIRIARKARVGREYLESLSKSK